MDRPSPGTQTEILMCSDLFRDDMYFRVISDHERVSSLSL